MDDIIALDELLKLPVEEARSAMLELSKNNSDQKLAEAWSKHPNYVRKLRGILGIHKNHSGTVINLVDYQGEKWPPQLNRVNSRGRGRAAAVIAQDNAAESGGQSAAGFTFTLKGVFTAEELRQRIEAISVLTNGSEERVFNLSLSLEELVTAQEVDNKKRRREQSAIQ